MSELDKLYERIGAIHIDCFTLIKNTFGYYLPVSGNIAVFCQSEDEYDKFLLERELITKVSDDPKQKYFELKEPVEIAGRADFPATTYTHLYIRKPDTTDYGKFKGDVDFIVGNEEYRSLVKEVTARKYGTQVVMYDRPGWDTIQITAKGIKSVAYVSTIEMAIKARFKFD